MRIVVSSESDGGLKSSVSHHFGRCPFFTIVDIDGGAIGSVNFIENPFYGSHAPGQVPTFIRKLGADAMIAGGMGRRAIDMFAGYGIGCSTGALTTVGEAVEDFLSGRLAQASPCRESVLHSSRDRIAGEEGSAGTVPEE
jgi:predicted Fe-Mo cluster-binding NifX family protein